MTLEWIAPDPSTVGVESRRFFAGWPRALVPGGLALWLVPGLTMPDFHVGPHRPDILFIAVPQGCPGPPAGTHQAAVTNRDQPPLTHPVF
jgi:hypothetical protein